MAEKQRPKIPLAQAATDLACLCDALDNGAAPDAALSMLFAEKRLDLVEAIDRRIAFLGTLEAQIIQVRKMAKAWRDKACQLEESYARLSYATKELLESHPDLPYQGTLGKLVIKGNGGVKPLETLWGAKALGRDEVEMFGIDQAYYRVETTYALETNKVRQALENGEELGWAKLCDRGTRLDIKLESKA